MDVFEPVEVPVGDGRVYRVRFPHDPDAECPRSSDGNHALLLMNRGGATVVNEIAASSEPHARAVAHFLGEHRGDSDAVVRRYVMWRAITGSPYRLISGSGYATACQSDWMTWYALTENTNTARVEIEIYRRWLAGEVFGWCLSGPDGSRVDSCFGYYDREAADADWRAELRAHERQLRQQASVAGAGLIGVI
ncbi:Uncharacterised protein [Nocardia cyriacigeorgica]|uniref:Uncharacterized protein n=2 Tax=Nocardia cyriacigeorgica TaxID=135487 RepID=A0A4U8VUX8_9NOCA|nr:Uncharacterised protein [Nocardia cyriacigeorgica]